MKNFTCCTLVWWRWLCQSERKELLKTNWPVVVVFALSSWSFLFSVSGRSAAIQRGLPTRSGPAAEPRAWVETQGRPPSGSQTGCEPDAPQSSEWVLDGEDGVLEGRSSSVPSFEKKKVHSDQSRIRLIKLSLCRMKDQRCVYVNDLMCESTDLRSAADARRVTNLNRHVSVCVQQYKACVRAGRVCVAVAAVWISQVGNTPVCVIGASSSARSTHTARVRYEHMNPSALLENVSWLRVCNNTICSSNSYYISKQIKMNLLKVIILYHIMFIIEKYFCII